MEGRRRCCSCHTYVQMLTEAAGNRSPKHDHSLSVRYALRGIARVPLFECEQLAQRKEADPPTR